MFLTSTIELFQPLMLTQFAEIWTHCFKEPDRNQKTLLSIKIQCC